MARIEETPPAPYCGHPPAQQVSSAEGTHYCAGCERQAAEKTPRDHALAFVKRIQGWDPAYLADYLEGAFREVAVVERAACAEAARAEIIHSTGQEWLADRVAREVREREGPGDE